MNNSLTVFRNHAKTSRSQLLLAQSSNARKLTHLHGKPLIVLAAVPVVFFGLVMVMAGSAGDQPAMILPAVHAHVEQSYIAIRIIPLSTLNWIRTDG